MSSTGMPPQLMSLFHPRDDPPFLPKPKIKKSYVGGMAQFVHLIHEEKTPPAKEPFETPKQRKERLKKLKIAEYEKKLEKLREEYDPTTMANPTKDPFRTLFVGRLSYITTEKKLKKEFEAFGKIRRIRLISDLAKRPRGYAFIEFENEKSMKNAYREASGLRIDGRRIIVDVERCRTVTNWFPRRLGGGKGSGREAQLKKEIILKERREIELAKRAAGIKDRPPRDGRPPFRDGGRDRDGGRGGGGGYRGERRFSER